MTKGKVTAAATSPLALLSGVYVTRVLLGLPLRIAAGVYLAEVLVYAVCLKIWGPRRGLGVILSLASALLTWGLLRGLGAMSLVFWEPLGLLLSALVPPTGWFLCGCHDNGRAFAYGVGVYFLIILALSSWVVGNSNFILAPLQIGLVAFDWVGFMALVVLRFRRLSPRAVQSLVVVAQES